MLTVEKIGLLQMDWAVKTPFVHAGSRGFTGIPISQPQLHDEYTQNNTGQADCSLGRIMEMMDEKYFKTLTMCYINAKHCLILLKNTALSKGNPVIAKWSFDAQGNVRPVALVVEHHNGCFWESC